VFVDGKEYYLNSSLSGETVGIVDDENGYTAMTSKGGMKLEPISGHQGGNHNGN